MFLQCVAETCDSASLAPEGIITYKRVSDRINEQSAGIGHSVVRREFSRLGDRRTVSLGSSTPQTTKPAVHAGSCRYDLSRRKRFTKRVGFGVCQDRFFPKPVDQDCIMASDRLSAFTPSSRLTSLLLYLARRHACSGA